MRIMDWDDREDKLDDISKTNVWRHSMECPNCRSRTWSFCCFIPDFKTGRIKEGCNECDEKAKSIWSREANTSSSIGFIVIGVIGVIGFVAGYLIK